MSSIIDSVSIRAERQADHNAIKQLLITAFENAPFSQHNEHIIVDALREQKALTLSLVAEFERQIIGHIAFSPVQIGDAENWFALGPLAVAPHFQKHGLGLALIKHGLMALKDEHGANGCVVLGDPNYYRRAGFDYDPNIIYEDAPPEYFMTQPFYYNNAAGSTLFHFAFYITENET